MTLDEALELANRTEYGLTAGIYSEKEDELDTFFERIQAGVTYANRRAGATTGAWPGINPFGGWKASGSTGRGHRRSVLRAAVHARAEPGPHPVRKKRSSMRARTLGSLGAGLLLLCSLALAAQAPVPSQSAPLPGPSASRPPAPGAPRDGATQPATGTGRILGRVVSADSGSPLRRAQVRIFAAEQRVTRSAITDAEGRYQFSELPAGRYSNQRHAERLCHVVVRTTAAVRTWQAARASRQTGPEKVDFALPRGGVIARADFTDENRRTFGGYRCGSHALSISTRRTASPDARRRRRLWIQQHPDGRIWALPCVRLDAGLLCRLRVRGGRVGRDAHGGRRTGDNGHRPRRDRRILDDSYIPALRVRRRRRPSP